jgi:phosphatidylserine/phosphatidylglycerophosphate/cardiolipin synthase-like enzyme
MPIEHVTLNILDAPLKNLFTWLPRDGGKEDFQFLDKETESERIICTHPSNPCILNTMVKMIENAQDNVLLCNWMLSHIKVESALVRAASRLNGRVHVLTTLETSVHSRYTGDETALNDLSRLQKLAGEGVYIRLHPEAHAKFLIVDDQVLVTSANIRDTSLEKNIETGVLSSNPQIVKDFRSMYAHIWLQEAKQHIRPSKSDPRLGNTWKSDKSEPPTFDGDANWTLSNRRMSLAKQIIVTINAAKVSLRISTYALSSLEAAIGNQILKAIIEADKRGVQTTILYHATSTAIGRPPREHESHGVAVPSLAARI